MLKSPLDYFFATSLFWLFLASVASGKPLKLVMGLALPPYIISESKSGIEYEVVTKALAEKGHTFEPISVPLKRVPMTLELPDVDGALTLTSDFKFSSKVFLSKPYISYQNFAIALQKNKLSINSIEQLKDFSIAAFQNAAIYLGPMFAALVKNHSNYNEFSRQVVQNRMLFRGRVDVVVGDKNIFRYYNREISKEFDTKQIVDYFPIFPPNHYVIAFKERQIRDDFNIGLQKIFKKNPNLLEKLETKYLAN